MRNWKRMSVAAGLASVFAIVWAFGSGEMPAQTPRTGTPAKTEAPGKGKRAQEFIAAFNKGDAKAVAGFYTPSGEYVDITGRKYKGRLALEKMYSKFFAENKGATLTITVSSARMISPDAALEEGLTEVNFPEGGPPSVAAFAAVVVKQDGEWYFESVRDTVAQPPSNAEHFEDIEWLLGDWTGEATKGESARASYSWAENRNFMVSTFATTLNGLPVVGGTQWIAWDAIDKKIRSFSFYSGGGIGEAVWMKEGAAWHVQTTAKSADGKKISGVNVITPIDKDHCTWQMTKLTVDGQSLPDPAPVKMMRVKEEK